jgi:hypothetical protein
MSNYDRIVPECIQRNPTLFYSFNNLYTNALATGWREARAVTTMMIVDVNMKHDAVDC